ncbi:MAG: BTAD domain-containing putative transcriptional regulator [Gemmatimonadaceae bacterium]
MMRLRTLGALELLDSAGQPLNSVVVQPKRVALLAYLAVASPRGFHRRDQILLVFWPDLTEDRARNALRQAVHHLRQQLGDDVIVSRGAEEIGIREGALWSDTTACEDALAQGDDAAAVALYRGPLLSGFHFGDAAPEFEQWLDERRRQLSAVVTAAASRCSETAERAGDLAEAARWAETAFQKSEGDERLLRRAIALLDAAGDGAGALQRYARFEEQLQRQLSTVPSQETRALVANLRAGRRDHETTAAPERRPDSTRGALPIVPNVDALARHDAQPIAPDISTPQPPNTSGASQSRYWRLAAIAAAAAAVVVVVAAAAVFSPIWNAPHKLSTAAAPAAASAIHPVSSSPVLSSERIVATQLYNEGLFALNASDARGAEQLFVAALKVDSTFAMAAYAAALADRVEGHTDILRAEQYLRLASRQSYLASDRDRLLIANALADFQNDPARLAFADTLAVRYPSDPEGQLSLGAARLWDGNFIKALVPLRAAVTLDSIHLASGRTRCIACSALQLEILALRFADSISAAERVARMWTTAVPTSATAWRELGIVLSAEGRTAEARAAYRASADRTTEGPGENADMIRLAIRAGAFDVADALTRTEITGGNAHQRQQGRWLAIISLRNQGRLREALVIARVYRADVAQNARRENLEMYEALPEAQVLFEMGRQVQAAALFDSIARDVHRTILPRSDARNRAWIGTLTAEAMYASGDAAGLARVRTSVRSYGAQSAFGRDQRLANHIDGLVSLHSARLTDAVVSFRLAMFSPTLGYTRTNYDMALALLGLGRGREAIAILQPAFRGDLDGSNMYVTRTDLHEVLARAFDMNSQPDSAVAHYSAVAAALSHADPEVAPRRVAALRRIVELGGHT